MRKRARVLTALAGKDWGGSRKILTSIYKALVESVMWYGAAGWLPWLSKSNLKKLDRSQRMALGAVTGLPKTTNYEVIYLEAEVDPIHIEAKRRALCAYEKSLHLPMPNPRREMCERIARVRLVVRQE